MARRPETAVSKTACARGPPPRGTSRTKSPAGSSQTTTCAPQWAETPYAAVSTRALVAAHTISSPWSAKPECPLTANRMMAPRDRAKRTRSADLGERDFFNPEFGDRLAMTVTGADALLRLVAEGHDLGGQALAHDAGADGGVLDERRSDDQFVAVVCQQDAVEDDFGIGVASDAIEAKSLAFLYF